MFWAIVIGVIGLAGLGVGLTMWSGYENPPKKGEPERPRIEKPPAGRAAEAHMGRIITVASIGILIGVAAWYKLFYLSDQQVGARAAAEASSKCDDRVMAYVMSQRFVEQRLKSPSSADFPMITSIKSDPIGGCKFDIAAYVDAQNGFGAMIRTRYVAEMEYLPNTDKWKANSLQLLK